MIRASLAHGGDATKVWTLREVLRVADETTGTRVLSSMFEQYAMRGDRIDLDGLFASMGLRGGEAADETSTLAWVRRGIVEAPPGEVRFAKY